MSRGRVLNTAHINWCALKIMDGENNGNPYLQMDDLGGFNPLFLETPI